MRISTKFLSGILKAFALLFVLLLVQFSLSRIASYRQRVTVHEAEGLLLPPDRKSTVTIATYNIAHGRGLAESNWQGGSRMERNYRLDKIAGLLMELNADFVILNEVDFDSSWSFSVDQARYLAETAGYRYWAEERNLDFRILFWKWRFGNAVLSRYPIREARIIDFPEFSPLESFLAGKKRGIDCIIDLNGKTWRILGVHLSHRSEEVRARSAGMLLEISDSNPVPTIIAGDFNSSPPGFPGSHSHPEAGNAIAVIDDGKLFQRYPQEPPETSGGYTFHAARPIAVIDWIFIPVEHQIQNFRVVSSTLSDHRPVVAEVSKERTRTIIEQE